MKEPFTPTPKPCSTPHSAPSRWLNPAVSNVERYDPGILPGRQADPEGPVPSEVEGLTDAQRDRKRISDFLDAYERTAPEGVRRDGWTPFLRKLFLQTIADTGRTSLACAYTHMSRSAAYELAQRDRVFAAGWDAAAQFARRPLADHSTEQMVGGITETITRPDGTIVTRHRYDTRLTIAVLNRLDKRCDRAEERGSVHLAAMRNWDEYLKLVGSGDDAAAEALLDRPVLSDSEKAQNCPACPLPERANPISAGDPPGSDPDENCWQAGTDRDRGRDREHALPAGTWLTGFPPPPGFDGYENAPFDGFNWYERTCTPEEVELIEARHAAAEAEERAEMTAFAEAQRDSFFARLRRELGREEVQPPVVTTGELKRERKAMLRRMVEAKAIYQENLQLKAALQLRQQTRDAIAAGRIVGSSFNSPRRFAIFSAGARDGVREGMPVRSPDGLVGRIIDVGTLASRVLLVSDRTSIVPARLLRNGIPVIAQGRGDGTVEVRPLEVGRNPFKPGDLIISSGTGGLYPPLVPVARVVKLKGDEAIGLPLADPATTSFAIVEPPYEPLAMASDNETSKTAP